MVSPAPGPTRPGPSPYTLDVRSLGAGRLILGLALTADLLLRLPWLATFYSDAGWLPRARAAALDPAVACWSWAPHFWSGSSTWALALHLLALAAAVGLALGWRTRACQLVSWLLLCSLHARDPLVIDRGSAVLRLALLWTLPLPMGATFSLDQRAGRALPRESPRVGGALAFGWLGQVALLYLFAGIHKTDPTWLPRGDALNLVLGLEELARPWARGLRAWPGPLRALTWGTMALEVLGPVALLWPRGQPRLRTLAVLGFMGLHVGIVAMMAIGPFPFTCLGVLTTLLPGELWDGGAPPSPPAPGSRRALAAAGLALGYVALWNVADHPDLLMEMAPAARLPGYLLRLDQRWDVFAPSPPGASHWWVLEAERADGTRVDLLTGAPPNYEAPPDVRGTFPSYYHWRLLNLARLAEYAPVRDWLPRRLAEVAGPGVVAVRVHELRRSVRLDHRVPRVRRHVVAAWPEESRSVTP